MQITVSSPVPAPVGMTGVGVGLLSVSVVGRCVGAVVATGEGAAVGAAVGIAVGVGDGVGAGAAVGTGALVGVGAIVAEGGVVTCGATAVGRTEPVGTGVDILGTLATAVVGAAVVGAAGVRPSSVPGGCRNGESQWRTTIVRAPRPATTAMSSTVRIIRPRGATNTVAASDAGAGTRWMGGIGAKPGGG